MQWQGRSPPELFASKADGGVPAVVEKAEREKRCRAGGWDDIAGIRKESRLAQDSL